MLAVFVFWLFQFNYLQSPLGRLAYFSVLAIICTPPPIHGLSLTRLTLPSSSLSLQMPPSDRDLVRAGCGLTSSLRLECGPPVSEGGLPGTHAGTVCPSHRPLWEAGPPRQREQWREDKVPQLFGTCHLQLSV